MPRKIESHDVDVKKRMNKIGAVLPFHLARARRYRSSQNWQDVRKVFLKEFPLCEDVHSIHSDENTAVPAKEVHHIRAVATHYNMRNYKKNLSALCVGCHHIISAMEKKDQPTYYLFRR